MLLFLINPYERLGKNKAKKMEQMILNLLDEKEVLFHSISFQTFNLSRFQG